MTSAFNVYLHGEKIDTIMDESGLNQAEDVARYLVKHSGYDPAITVEKHEPYKSEDEHDR